MRFAAVDLPEANDLTVGIMALVAQPEREAISRRTKEALAVARSRGVRLGNPQGAAALRRAGRGAAALRAAIARNADRHAQDLAPVVADIRAGGATSLRAIAGELNARGMLTRRGGRWHVSTVTNLLDRLGAREAACGAGRHGDRRMTLVRFACLAARWSRPTGVAGTRGRPRSSITLVDPRRWPSSPMLSCATRHHLVAAIADDRLVGFVSALDYWHPDKPRELWINEVGVSPAWQHRGVGTQLLQKTLEHARALGCVNAWVLTEPDNARALGLYRKVGGPAASDMVMFSFELTGDA